MKNQVFIVILSLFIGITSCSRNNDDDDTNPKSIDKTANLKATGTSANDILSNTNFDKLKIEIGYVDGFRPSTTAIIGFQSFLTQYTFKEDVEIVYKELSSPNEEKLTLEEVVDLEGENRTAYNEDTTLAVYIYFADAPSEEDVEEEDLVTLGAVYLNTSMVIYESTIRNLASKSIFVSISDIETATLNHEFGHLLGLVNLGSPAVNDHEDSEAVNHCSVEGCLMRAELQFGAGMKQMLEKRASKGMAAPPGLDDECVMDLQANGGR